MYLTSRLSRSLHQDPSAAALLGAEHPLVRVLGQLRVLLRQSLVVSAVLAASLGAFVEGQEFALSFILAASVVLAGLGCATITRAYERREQIRDLIIEGRGTLPLDAIETERRRLLARRNLALVARRLDSIRQQSSSPARRRPANRPLFNVRVIASVAPELADISKLLRCDHPGLPGVAKIERLLTHPNSCLYGNDPELLRHELRHIQFLLGE